MGLWHRLHNPSIFQGVRKKKDYFEGWYFKLISSNEEHAIGIIPGVSLGQDAHAFLQIIDGRAQTSHYFRYDLETFIPDTHAFRVQIGPHFFSEDKIVLASEEISGELNLHDLIPWRPSLLRPGIMGWYSFVPFMQCYHGLVSMNHRLNGILELKGAAMDFDGGKGYTEKDWGRSFPRSWIWTQCNHFDQELSVMASVAHIPWLGTHFVGFLALIWFGKDLKVFTTYTGARHSVQMEDDTVLLEFSDRNSKLTIRARQGPGVDLRSPISGNMAGKVNESLSASIEMEYHEDGIRKIKSNGTSAGLEVAGDVDELAK